MASNAFGTLFRFTSWGESHGAALGVVIDGCPAGLALDRSDIQMALERRAPGRSPFTTPRQESEQAEILSGLFEGKTTGAPICIMIRNRDADSSKYEPIKHLLRPGHANFTYLRKYGIFDYRGGGRSSARETAARVMAGAVAGRLLAHFGIEVAAYIRSIAGIESSVSHEDLLALRKETYASPVFCPHPEAAAQMMAAIEEAKCDGDSVGGVVEFVAQGVPIGLGDPVYEKVEAKLAAAMLSLPASKGFEIGLGFRSASLRASFNNDAFYSEGGIVKTRTNHAGGVLGGITNGMPLVGRVAFKPPSSIQKPQETVDLEGRPAVFQLPEGSRHDPCVAIRGVPVVEALVNVVLADCLLLQRAAQLGEAHV